MNETIIIRRRANDRIVIRHTIGDKEIDRTQVVRYSTDADDFLEGAKQAVIKLSNNRDKKLRDALLYGDWNIDHEEYPDTDQRSLKAGDKLLLNADYPRVSGRIVTFSHFVKGTCGWRIKEDDMFSLWRLSCFLGKIVPCGELKVGDELLVKSLKDIEGAKDSFHGPLADKIWAVSGHCGNNIIIKTDDANGYGETVLRKDRFVGKLIRFNQEGAK